MRHKEPIIDEFKDAGEGSGGPEEEISGPGKGSGGSLVEKLVPIIGLVSPRSELDDQLFV